MFKRVLSAGLLGGIVLIIWTEISFFILSPQTFKKFPNKKIYEVVELIRENIDETGFYTKPEEQHIGTDYESIREWKQKGHMVMVLVRKDPFNNLGIKLILTVLIYLFIPVIPAYMLSIVSKEKIKLYHRRVIFIALIGIIIALFYNIPKWSLYQYPFDFALASCCENLVGWTLAGLVIAWRINPEKF